MTEKDKPTVRESLARIFIDELGGVDAQKVSEPESIGTANIGSSVNAVDLYLDEQTLEWLDQTLKPDGEAFLDTVELKTAKGTIVLESDSVIRLSWGENDG